MVRAFLALGANIGDPPAQLEEAVRRIAETPGITLARRSSVIVTAPWGKTDQNDFHNMVVEVETSLTPQQLLAICLGIEAEMGRKRIERWGPRLIDIDIVAYGHEVIAEANLKVPHPYAHERAFVLDPLREIAQDVAEWIVGRGNKSG
jgi:2-amino-4-hydroxy-6-hydroxymethyldihydropteridine diphosphokinase